MPPDLGGDDACWLHRVCDDCGALVDERNGHRPGCSAATPAPVAAASRAHREPRWIPASPLVAGIAFQLAGWVIAGVHALHPRPSDAFAWVHAVALGWLTTIALSVLIRILPQTTDRPWRLEGLARGALAGVVAGAIGMVAGFFASTLVLAAGAVLAAASIGAYVFAALLTLARRVGGRREAAIARALGVTLALLGLTAIAGVILALSIDREFAVPAQLLPVHATLGVAGWLTILTTGVAARTLRVILDTDSRLPHAHVLVGSGLVAGVVLVCMHGPLGILAIVGFTVIAAAAACFALDAIDRAARSRVPNPAARIGVVASSAWIVVAALAALTASVRGSGTLGGVAVVAALVGWVGSMMLAHLHHIGVRLIATSVIGDDDETPPWALISAPLSVATLVAYEAGALLLCGGVAAGADAAAPPARAATFVLCAAALGVLATSLLAANLATAVARARSLRAAAI